MHEQPNTHDNCYKEVTESQVDIQVGYTLIQQIRLVLDVKDAGPQPHVGDTHSI